MVNKTGKKIAIGAAIAAAAGYVTGILTAPKSGKETRKDIGTAAQKAKSEAEKKLKELHSELSDLIDQGKAKGKDLGASAKKELSEAVDKAQMAKDKARGILSAIHEGDSEDRDLKKAVTDVKTAADHLKKFLKKSPAK